MLVNSLPLTMPDLKYPTSNMKKQELIEKTIRLLEKDYLIILTKNIG